MMQMAVGRGDYIFTWDLSSGRLWLVLFTFPRVYVCRRTGFSLEEKSLQADIAGDETQNFWNYSPVSLLEATRSPYSLI
jgi:hypothetical protein